MWVSRFKYRIKVAPVKFESGATSCLAHVGEHLNQFWDSNKSPLSIWLRVQETFLKWAGLKRRRFYRFDCIFKAQKHDCNKEIVFGCLEETCPYLRKPTPRKIIYLNPLRHPHMSTPAKSSRGVEELCSPPSGNIESGNTLNLGSIGSTVYPVLPQATATSG